MTDHSTRRVGEGRKRTKYVRVPAPPTTAMLQGMIEATFLSDSSLLEMERRFNGMIERVPKVPKRKVRK